MDFKRILDPPIRIYVEGFGKRDAVVKKSLNSKNNMKKDMKDKNLNKILYIMHKKNIYQKDLRKIKIIRSKKYDSSNRNSSSNDESNSYLSF